jgi:hypothetical protein
MAAADPRNIQSDWMYILPIPKEQGMVGARPALIKVVVRRDVEARKNTSV